MPFAPPSVFLRDGQPVPAQRAHAVDQILRDGLALLDGVADGQGDPLQFLADLLAEAVVGVGE